MFLANLFGSETAEKTLLYLENYQSGYALAIAQTYEVPVSQVQRQLEKFERDGILVSRFIGRTRLYEWSPRYLFLDELRKLLSKAISKLPEAFQEKYFRERRRPRRKGKPLP